MYENELIWFSSKQPNWKLWERMNAVLLRQALLLSMDVCPTWYQDVVLSAVKDYHETSEYRFSDANEAYERIKEVYEGVEQEFTERLKVSQSWAAQQDWIIGSNPLLPNEVREEIYVDLIKFLKFAFDTMGFNNRIDNIPNSIKPQKSQIKLPISLSSKEWKSKAKLYASEFLQQQNNLTLEAVSNLIFNRFKKELILTSYSSGREISVGSIKEAISKDAWFTNTRLDILKQR